MLIYFRIEDKDTNFLKIHYENLRLTCKTFHWTALYNSNAGGVENALHGELFPEMLNE